eukprot:TRINITY_DN16921_c0_g1_i1.p1 TRINITY_DN16921_c0_g1~~TRINITY_DN16921_c0_g1_i1.p1  ORF type:complete len:149 (+),score=40.27 TRINITY_DN16921_c0_g1_i1:58-447(+)
MAPAQKPVVDVTYEDQVKINRFSILNLQRRETSSSLSAVKARVENLDDAEAELMLQDEVEVIKYRIGNSYFNLSPEDAEEMLTKEIEEAAEEKSTLTETYEKIMSEMGQLKTELYAKFGKQINLEDDRE